jgi:hypothetical protein
MNVVVGVHAAAGPQEAMEPADLVKQLADSVRRGACGC